MLCAYEVAVLETVEYGIAGLAHEFIADREDCLIAADRADLVDVSHFTINDADAKRREIHSPCDASSQRSPSYCDVQSVFQD